MTARRRNLGEGPARRLKVFQAQLGFWDTIVAAPSQPAALRAWGVGQNLFASGQAKVVSDKAAIVAALAHPETPLRRPVGTAEPFALEPSSLPSVPDVPKSLLKVADPMSALKPRPASKPKPQRPPPDRAKLTAAEAELRDLDTRRKAEEADLRRQQDALERKIAAAQRRHVAARKTATATIVAERQRYRKVGGAD